MDGNLPYRSPRRRKAAAIIQSAMATVSGYPLPMRCHIYAHPNSSTRMSQVWKIWKAGYAPFQDVGSDSFMLATPNGNMLWSCDPAIIKAAFTNPSESQNPVEMFRMFDLWGPTLSSTEGDEHRTSRRIISSGFNPSTNQSVWEETMRQCGLILDEWAADGGVVKRMKDWTSPMALHVISYIFFNRKLGWNSAKGTESLPQGHSLTYEKSLFDVLEKLGILFVTPKALLGLVPLEMFRKASLAYNEFTKYMYEFRDGATSAINENKGHGRRNMLGNICPGSNCKTATNMTYF